MFCKNASQEEALWVILHLIVRRDTRTSGENILIIDDEKLCRLVQGYLGADVQQRSPPGRKTTDAPCCCFPCRRWKGFGSTTCYGPPIRPVTGPAYRSLFTNDGKTGRNVDSAAWLSARFAAAPPAENGLDDTSSCDNPTTCLALNAKQKTFSGHASNSNGDSVSATNTFYSLRSFSTDSDYYYLTNSTSYTMGKGSHSNVQLSAIVRPPTSDTVAVDISLNSTECTESLLTHASSHTVGYSVGKDMLHGKPSLNPMYQGQKHCLSWQKRSLRGADSYVECARRAGKL